MNKWTKPFTMRPVRAIKQAATKEEKTEKGKRYFLDTALIRSAAAMELGCTVKKLPRHTSIERLLGSLTRPQLEGVLLMVR